MWDGAHCSLRLIEAFRHPSPGACEPRSAFQFLDTGPAQAESRMEAALSWPARYLHQRPLVMRFVQSVARYRAIGFESDKISRKLNKPPRPSAGSTVPGSTPSLPGCGLMA